MAVDSEPLVIQGGMGVAVSGWRLARAVRNTEKGKAPNWGTT